MLIECKECKKQISEKAVTCPHCGSPVKDRCRVGIKRSTVCFIMSAMFLLFMPVMLALAIDKEIIITGIFSMLMLGILAGVLFFLGFIGLRNND